MTNDESTASFRKLFTHGFSAIDPGTGEVLQNEAHQKALDSTKAWRNKLWKAFNAVELQLRPMVALQKSKGK